MLSNYSYRLDLIGQDGAGFEIPHEVCKPGMKGYGILFSTIIKFYEKVSHLFLSF